MIARLAMTAAMAACALTGAAVRLGADPNGGLRVAQWSVAGRLDWQGMRMDGSGDHGAARTIGRLMAAEIETTATIGDGSRDVLDLGLQWPYATAMSGIDGRGRQMHFGNAYAVYKTGLGRPSVRFGQFVVPFGNLPSYETHTRPLQSLYPQSLGIRIDRGVSIEGIAGPYDYSFAIMGGNGARADNDGRPMVAARAARRLDGVAGGRLTVGASLLRGTAMPRFSPGLDPVMDSGMADIPADHLLSFTDKTRFGLDAELEAGRDTWRLEAIGGRDSDGSVNGQFVHWSRALATGAELTLQAGRWNQPIGARTMFGASIGRTVARNTVVRAWVSMSRGSIHGSHMREDVCGVQVTADFPRLFR